MHDATREISKIHMKRCWNISLSPTQHFINQIWALGIISSYVLKLLAVWRTVVCAQPPYGLLLAVPPSPKCVLHYQHVCSKPIVALAHYACCVVGERARAGL